MSSATTVAELKSAERTEQASVSDKYAQNIKKGYRVISPIPFDILCKIAIVA